MSKEDKESLKITLTIWIVSVAVLVILPMFIKLH
jgi:hypothetical protein